MPGNGGPNPKGVVNTGDARVFDDDDDIGNLSQAYGGGAQAMGGEERAHLSQLTDEDRSHAYGGGLLKYGTGAFATLLRPLAFGEPMTASLSSFMVCPTWDAMAFSASVISAPFWVDGI